MLGAKVKVFIDGSSGTTGLQIHGRLEKRGDVDMVKIPESVKKDPKEKEKAYAESDVIFLCLPDAASKEAAGMIPEGKIVIDTSTAFRTSDGWVYGFPEMKGQRAKIADAERIANPGCHAIGFISLVKPLVDAKLLDKGKRLACYSVTGYSGGGKKMIEEYEKSNDALLSAPRAYGLTQMHKHIPEMMKIGGLEKAPLFSPIVSNYYSGMEVTVLISAEDLNGTADEASDVYSEYYTDGVVKYKKSMDEDGFLSASALSGKDIMEITVTGNGERISLTSRFDNLGKGASGSAIQNMNIAMGIDEKTGLRI